MVSVQLGEPGGLVSGGGGGVPVVHLTVAEGAAWSHLPCALMCPPPQWDLWALTLVTLQQIYRHVKFFKFLWGHG